VIETRRAAPMGLEARQDMIIAAVTPLLLEHGASVTSRQIAEAAGIAEGTVFRAFGDKESLIAAAVERYLDPLALHTALRSIDPDLPLDDKLRAIFGLLRERFRGVIRMFAMVPQSQRQPREPGSAFAAIIAELLEPHRDQLRVQPQEVAQYARLITFASAIPVFGESLPISDDQIVDFLMYGVKSPTTTSITEGKP
jgi:AcrR family transcriptional regulator